MGIFRERMIQDMEVRGFASKTRQVYLSTMMKQIPPWVRPAPVMNGMRRPRPTRRAVPKQGGARRHVCYCPVDAS